MANMTDAVVCIGLPASGKTTYLAALWYLVTTQESAGNNFLEFDRLLEGNYSHLNDISNRWAAAQDQERTRVVGDLVVQLALRNRQGESMVLSFPDVAGETFQEMWEKRQCDPSTAEMLGNGNVLLFIHANKIEHPAPIALGLDGDGEEIDEQVEVVPWDETKAPTQVMLVSLLSMLNEPILTGAPRQRRLAVLLSAWDAVEGQSQSPGAFLDSHLPLLAQFLRQNGSLWEWRIFGVSAQGGPYDEPNAHQQLLDLDSPVLRAKITSDGNAASHDLTEPLEWLVR